MSIKKPTRKQAIKAIQTIISWIGDNPERQELLPTPDRVLRSYEEFFVGYNQDPLAIMADKTFDYDYNGSGMVILKDIEFRSYCEHHLLPIIGVVHVAYIPDKELIGISKVARVVDAHARRLQLQEKLTKDIAYSLNTGLRPKGVAVVIQSRHECMSSRGVFKNNALMITDYFLGELSTNEAKRREFLDKVG